MTDRASAQQRIAVANVVLRGFCKSVVFYLGDRELRIQFNVFNGRRDYPARLRKDGHWFVPGVADRYPGGGTSQNAACTLVQYIRDQPRLPLLTWEFWSSAPCNLVSPEAVAVLARSDYGDPKKIGCIFCGSTIYPDGLDWWSLEGVRGPCCQRGKCTENRL